MLSNLVEFCKVNDFRLLVLIVMVVIINSMLVSIARKVFKNMPILSTLIMNIASILILLGRIFLVIWIAFEIVVILNLILVF